jgi:hypothetical protein
VGAYFGGTCARVGERFADAAGPTFKASDRTLPFLTVRQARVRDFCFLIVFFLRACALFPLLFRIRSAATTCTTRPPKTPLP